MIAQCIGDRVEKFRYLLLALVLHIIQDLVEEFKIVSTTCFEYLLLMGSTLCTKSAETDHKIVELTSTSVMVSVRPTGKG